MSGNDAIVAVYYIQGCEDVRRGEVNNRALKYENTIHTGSH